MGASFRTVYSTIDCGAGRWVVECVAAFRAGLLTGAAAKMVIDFLRHSRWTTEDHVFRTGLAIES